MRSCGQSANQPLRGALRKFGPGWSEEKKRPAEMVPCALCRICQRAQTHAQAHTHTHTSSLARTNFAATQRSVDRRWRWPGGTFVFILCRNFLNCEFEILSAQECRPGRLASAPKRVSVRPLSRARFGWSRCCWSRDRTITRSTT